MSSVTLIISMFNLIKSSCEIPWRSPWEYQNVPHILITRFFILPCNKMFSYKSAIESNNEFISKWMQNWPRDSKKLLFPIIDFHEMQNKPVFADFMISNLFQSVVVTGKLCSLRNRFLFQHYKDKVSVYSWSCVFSIKNQSSKSRPQ